MMRAYLIDKAVGAMSARFIALCLLAISAIAGPSMAQDANALLARYQELRQPLSSNQFQRPLYLESSQSSGKLKGDIYALIGLPVAVVGPVLRDSDHWCEILILHLNVKGCRAIATNAGEILHLNIGRKFDQPLADTYKFDFLHRVVADSPDYQQVVLEAAQGPLGTSHYRFELEVVGLDRQRSFLHLSYAYSYGIAARVAMLGYLATTGHSKVGFSVVGRDAGGQPIYMSGIRGSVERNTMRYYLAIEAYLGALSVPASQQLEKRLNDWYAGIERYPLQLHELERSEYLDMKHREIARQQTQGS